MQPIPVTVLSGFLGAGKTTLLRHLLKAEHGLKIAVIENEFSDAGIDTQLLGDELTTVTNTQHRNAQFVDAWVQTRRTLNVHALWPARQNDGGRLAALHFVGSNAMRDDF